MTIKLRPYQTEAIDALMAWFEKNNQGNPLLCLPTGAGKSIVLAKICEIALQYPNQKIAIVTHSKELVEQNFLKLNALCPSIGAGIYCAGLGKKQLHYNVTFASIQSIFRKHIELGFVNLLLIDECHMVSDSTTGSYRKFIAGLKSINPKLRVVGLTATPFRLKSGLLHRGEGALFHGIAYDLSLQRLVKEEWLARMIGKKASTQGDTDNLHIQAGEFIIKEAENVFDEEKLVHAAVKEMLSVGYDRKTWLIFCVSIKHAEHVAKVLKDNGVDCKSISEKTGKHEREQIIKDMKSGSIRAVTNVAVMTTGLDVPNIDMIVMLRPTMSPGLLLQMAGRGLRQSKDTGKKDCLFLDMAGVLLHHGPITHITAPPQGVRMTREKKGKECPKCMSVCASHATECEDCGYIFPPQPRKIKHAERATHAAVMSDDPVAGNDIYEWYDVKSVSYSKHEKLGSNPSLKVTYKCRYNFSEWVCFEHEGFAREKAVAWWNDRFHGAVPVPNTVDEAIAQIMQNASRIPTQIKVKKDGKFPEIKGYKFDESARQKQSASLTGNLEDLHRRIAG